MHKRCPPEWLRNQIPGPSHAPSQPVLRADSATAQDLAIAPSGRELPSQQVRERPGASSPRRSPDAVQFFHRRPRPSRAMAFPLLRELLQAGRPLGALLLLAALKPAVSRALSPGILVSRARRADQFLS